MLTRRAVIAAPSLLLAQKTAEERPNILFMAADDLTAKLGCYGAAHIKSPNLDRLAARSVRFDRAYCNFPLCGPSRTSLLSGMRPDTTRIWRNEMSIADTMPFGTTLPQLFRQNGYLSARFGKMYHMNVPGSVGKNLWDDPKSWDIAVSPPGGEDKTKGPNRNVTPKFPAGNAMHWISFAGDGKDQADDSVAEQTIETISKNPSKPWFIGAGFVRPHVPHVAPSRFFDLYPLATIAPVTNPANDRDDIPEASELTLNGRGNDMGMNEADKKEALRGYYASISYMDSLAGRVLDHLDKTGQTRKTVVVFWSDHGWHLGEHFRWQKRSLFEESMRVPLIVSAPGRKGNGKASQALVELVDLYPTLANLAGLASPPTLEGQSFTPVLDQPDVAWKTAAFCQVAGDNGIVGRAVRTADWRYIRWEGPKPAEELYDQKADPREFNNLAKNPASLPQLNALRKILDGGWQGARTRVG